MRTLPILYCGREIGTVKSSEEGLYLRFEARTDCHVDGICRVYLQFENGERLLGVMEPRHTGMCCMRCFAKQQLRCLGVWKGAVLREKGEELWQSYDGNLPGAFAARIPKEGAMQRREENSIFLALPYTVNAPFPLTELFCLASVCRINGNDYIMYRFSNDGTPKI